MHRFLLPVLLCSLAWIGCGESSRATRVPPAPADTMESLWNHAGEKCSETKGEPEEARQPLVSHFAGELLLRGVKRTRR